MENKNEKMHLQQSTKNDLISKVDG